MPIEFPLIFLGGLLGSSHCIGMCGGFVVALGGSAPTTRANLLRQGTFSVGRLLVYSTLGAFAGAGGLWFTHRFAELTWLQAALGILAGSLLIVQGLRAAGFFRKKHSAGTQCLTAGAFRSLLVSPRLSYALVAGILTGFLPCGLVYAFLALAASAHSLPMGAATMFFFGLGTIPLMLAVGGGISLMSLRFRQRMLTLAAWCVIVTGVISVARGICAVPWEASSETSTTTGNLACPFCSDHEG